MPKLIKDGLVVEDNWQLIPAEYADDALKAEYIIVPLAAWNENREALSQRDNIGVWLDSDQAPELIAEDINQFAVIGINFPAFTDGRGFSYGRELRENLNFSGEIRAVGNFIRDQLFYLKRCGFNAFAFAETIDLDDAAKSLSDFSDGYQAAIDQPQPLFRRRG